MSSVGGVRLRGALFAVGVAFLALTPAGDVTATTYARPQHAEVSFAKWVAQADQIVLARVISVRSLPPHSDATEMPFPADPFEFTLQTIEAIKGKTPRTFTLTGFFGGWNDGSNEQATVRHTRIGSFWTLFAGGSGQRNFMLNAEYLVFRKTDGSRFWMLGRDAELIPARDDPWLLAVKRLASNPSLRYGRKATVIDFLTSARAVVVAETLTCDRPEPPPNTPADTFSRPGPGKTRIVKQLWGSPIVLSDLQQMYAWGVFEKCDKGQQRLLVVESNGWPSPLRLRVAASDKTIDFGGLIHGTDDGQILDEMMEAELWQAEVEVTGKTKWSIAELDAALRQVASGREATAP